MFTAVAPYESWIREHVTDSEPGPSFPSQLQMPQSGPWEPGEENCTFAQPGEAGLGRFELGWRLQG